MPIYKNVARRIAVQVRVTGGVTPYVAATWANSAVAKMYYSKDGAAGTAVSPSRIDATLGGWELSTGILDATAWNCDELRVWWEGSGIDFGEVVFYPEDSWTSAKAAFVDAAISGRASQASVDTIDDLLDAEMPALTSAVAAVQADTDNIQTRLPAALSGGKMDSVVAASDIRGALGMSSANLDTQLSALSTLLNTVAGYLDTEVQAIKDKTDGLPSDPADASVLATSFATLTTLINDVKAIAQAAATGAAQLG